MSDDPAVERIREELDKRGWSQRRLADKALLGEATVFRLLKGEYTAKTLRRIEYVLELDQIEQPAKSTATADLQYGGYSKALYAYYEGSYLCVKQSAHKADRLYANLLTIEWDTHKNCLVFHDLNPSYQQSGTIMVAQGTQFLHFLTSDKGSARLITAFHMPESRNTIRGLSLTLANPKGRLLYPAAYPVIMKRITDETASWRKISGYITVEHPEMVDFVREFDEMALDPILLKDYH